MILPKVNEEIARTEERLKILKIFNTWYSSPEVYYRSTQDSPLTAAQLDATIRWFEMQCKDINSKLDKLLQ